MMCRLVVFFNVLKAILFSHLTFTSCRLSFDLNNPVLVVFHFAC